MRVDQRNVVIRYAIARHRHEIQCKPTHCSPDIALDFCTLSTDTRHAETSHDLRTTEKW